MTKDPLQFRLKCEYFAYGDVLLICTLCEKQEVFDVVDEDNPVTLNDLLLWGWKHECDENSG